MNNEFNYSKLKGKIRELDMTLSEYANAIGITEQTLNLRFQDKRPFKQDEIIKTMELFNESVENIHIYFFTRKVAKSETN